MAPVEKVLPTATASVPVAATQPSGFLSFTLHAHLPYVVNHGTWPHGLEWLLEAAAETYLPLLRVLTNLERDGIALHCNLVFSPILLEQLAHPVFLAEFPNYVNRKITAAREDEAFFLQSGEHHLAETARFWQRFFTLALEDFAALGGDLIQGFRHFNEAGLIRIIPGTATHGYLPLLGTDESVRAQVRIAVETHQRHFGASPTGIWLTECGYRPAGYWRYPVVGADGNTLPQGFNRLGLEQVLAESHLEYFIADTHLVEDAKPLHSAARSLYRPYSIAGKSASTVAVFPRDPRTGLQVWSGEFGYPGDFNYLDFHKKRFPGGHRYWKVTGAYLGMEGKQPYSPKEAAERIQVHAHHFVQLVRETLQPHLDAAMPPILCAPFDAELFGHWWFEGAMWLEAVARAVHETHAEARPTATIDCANYLAQYPPQQTIALHEGSWGAEGNNKVWLNPETSWTYTHIYPAELYVREIATAGKWSGSEIGTRIARQLCRELLLLESSDWQFLITTGTARDYAETRFLSHKDQFDRLRILFKAWEVNDSLSTEEEKSLAEIEERDRIFPGLDPGLWASIPNL